MTKALERKLSEKTQLIYLLSGIVLLMAVDQYIELSLGSTLNEILIDILLETPRLILISFVIYFFWKQLSQERKRKRILQKSLDSSRKQGKVWQKQAQSFVKEFEIKIINQLNEWKLTKSEIEVALLILKGKSTKEISELRFTSDRTTRNQCRSIYDKSGLSGRHELSGHFLEKLLS